MAGHKSGRGRLSLINNKFQRAMRKKMLNAPTATAKQLN
jgi:hypothetical protein